MWVLQVNRRELVDLLAQRSASQAIDAVEKPHLFSDFIHSERITALWPADPNEYGRMPTVIITADGERRDVMAWLSTYVRDFRPFTAYCRVVEQQVFEQFLNFSGTPRLTRMEGICAGLILGESLMYGRGRASILDLPFSAYSATLSHAISRAYALTGGTISIDSIAKVWAQTREITGQNVLVPPSDILSVWSIVLRAQRHTVLNHSLFSASDILDNAWMELTSYGELSDELWFQLTQGYSDLIQMRLISNMPREQRVHMVDTALQMLLSSGGDVIRRSFLAGYVTSLLGPGSIDHADFLTPVATILPTSYLWYGLFAGINLRGDALPVGNPLARRIIRDLTIPDRVIDRPRCDIAFEELMMHSSRESFLKMTSKAGRLDIDLLPGVTTSVRWPPQEMSDEITISRMRDNEVRHLLAEMNEFTLRSLQLGERLREVLRLGESSPTSAQKRKRSTKDR